MKILVEFTVRNYCLQLVANRGLGWSWLWGAGWDGEEAYVDLGPVFLSASLFNIADEDGDEDFTVH